MGVACTNEFRELKTMKRAHLLFSVLLLTVASFAQQPSNNPQDRSANPADHTYTRPVENGRNWGGWGWLGLLGLAGLLGRRRQTTTVITGTDYTRGDHTYEEQRRRAS
jgi:MYXO-CTERM domain-containing protein